MSDTPNGGENHRPAAELTHYGRRPPEVRRRLWAVEYAALDDGPCWSCDDPVGLPEAEGGVAC